MKKNFLSCLMLLLSLVVFGQPTIENPVVGFSSTSMIRIQKIEILDTATVLYFRASANPGTGFSIPDKTFIKPADGTQKLFITHAEGVTINDQSFIKESGEINYKLYFPKIENTVKTIDYGEDNGGNWNIYDIQLKPLKNSSNLPQDLLGNWFNINTGNWEISLFDTLVIYKSQPWVYIDNKLKDGKGSIKIKGKTGIVELFVKTNKDGSCSIGESGKTANNYSKNINKINVKTKDNDKPYQLPVFKIDSATYSGYLKGYTPRIGGKTMGISIDDIVTGEQNSFTIKISDNGFFTVKLPLYYPHITWVRSTFYNGSVFLEPGKTVFHMVDPGSSDGSSLFMGELGKVNADLLKLEKINSFNYYEMRSKILEMKPADYKVYCQNLQKKDTEALEAMMQTSAIGAKAYQVKKLDIVYSYFSDIMEYDWNFEAAYREKHKIPREQRTLPIKMDSLTAAYYNFITNENANNSLAVLCPGYNSFINRLKYLDILRGSNFSITTLGIAEELQKSGYTFTESEKTLVEKLRKQEEILNLPDYKAFQQKYGKLQQDFFKTYQDTLKPLFSSGKEVKNIEIEKHLIEKGVQLTDREKEYLKAAKEYDNSDDAKKIAEYFKSNPINNDLINQFHEKHNQFLNSYFAKKQKKARNENLEKRLGVKLGFASDIMNAQDVSRGIVEEMSPVSDNEIKDIQKQISTPFIAGYIAWCNQQTKLKLEANKLKTDYVVNNVPKTEADKLFDGIMAKYKGKVVYVDFWATWCGPCRSGIEQIKPLKEEMAGKDVVFVYITGPSSPENTWSNMIPGIKGEHYRVSNDEWNFLCGKFNISGIPHCILVGKRGEVINPKLGHMDNGSLKAELEKRMIE